MNVNEASNLIKWTLLIGFLASSFGVAVFAESQGWVVDRGQKFYLVASFATVFFVYVFGVGSWWGFLSGNDLKKSYTNWSADTSTKPAPTGEGTNPEKKRALDSKNQNVTGPDEASDPSTGNK